MTGPHTAESKPFGEDEDTVLRIVRDAGSPMAPEEILHTYRDEGNQHALATSHINSIIWQLVDTGKLEFTRDWRVKPMQKRHR